MESHRRCLLLSKPGLSLTTLCTVLLVMSGPEVCSALKGIGKFWHVTDFHYDHTYLSSMLSCNMDGVSPKPFGDYWCDSPWTLITASLEAMNRYHADVDFLLWTGDTVAHISDDNLSVVINMEVLSNLTSAIKAHFPSKTVYATFGNHDYWPSDQLPGVTNAIYNRTAEMWEDWIEEEEQLANFRKGGYYTRKTPQGLRIVALNTNLYYTSDKVTPGNPDPADQLQWLRAVLQSASDAGEKVLVTAHIPPGIHTPNKVIWFHDEFIDPVNNALKEFADVIVGMHFGHDHADGFKVFLNKDGKPAAPLFVAPAVTPWRYKQKDGTTGPPHNPAVRLVTYDRDTGRHLNIEQLMLDLPKANAAASSAGASGSSSSSGEFTMLYNFTQHYRVPDISASSLDKLVTRMGRGTEGDQLLDDYYRFTVSGAGEGEAGKICDRSCKNSILCGFKHYTNQEYEDCMDGLTSSAPSLSGSQLLTAVMLALTVALSSRPLLSTPRRFEHAAAPV